MTEKDYLTFNEIALNPKRLNFDPDAIDEDGNVNIGDIESLDGSVCNWTIAKTADGYALKIKMIFEGYDDNGDRIEAKDDKACYCIPIVDNADTQVPTTSLTDFDSIPSAFDAFMEFAFATERSEQFYYVREKALSLLNGYADAEYMEFEEFKKAFEAVTYWDDYHYRWNFTRVANAMLCLRYPFLVSWSHNDDWEILADDDETVEERDWFDHTRFGEIPDGWAHRFGLELCEDLRNQAWDENPKVWEYRMREASLLQTKEKFGTLRTYWSIYGEKSIDIMSIYEEISAITCINCGRADKTRLTGGWISPYCWDEILKKSESVNNETNKFIKAHAEDEGFDWIKRSAARTYFALSAVVDTTHPLAKSKLIEKLFTEWNHISYGKEGTKIVNHAIGLLDGTPAPNGEPMWVRKVLEGVLEDIQKLETWVDDGYPTDDDYSIKDLAQEYNLDLPDWWSGYEEPAEPA